MILVVKDSWLWEPWLPYLKYFPLSLPSICKKKTFLCPIIYPPLVKKYLLGTYSLPGTRETKTNKALFATSKEVLSPLPCTAVLCPGASWDCYRMRGLVAILYTTRPVAAVSFRQTYTGSFCLRHLRLWAFLKPWQVWASNGILVKQEPEKRSSDYRLESWEGPHHLRRSGDVFWIHVRGIKSLPQKLTEDSMIIHFYCLPGKSFKKFVKKKKICITV